MTAIANQTIDDGSKALELLLNEINKSNFDWNEAETRFQIIDRLIVECLGWPRGDVRLERRQQDGKFTDYELGLPRCAIWEAKTQGKIFELPADPKGRIIKDLPSIMALDNEASSAIVQVQNYCSTRGVEIAVATNGHQLIAFLATRNDGTSPLEGRCLVIDGYQKLQDNFPKVWQMLSPAGVAERRLNRFLNVGEDIALPQKMSSLLSDYPRYRYPSDLQHSLRTLSELLIIDVVDQQDAERQFYEQCYCESGALSQHALVSKEILASRYSSLFDKREKAPKMAPVQSKGGKSSFTPEILDDTITQRPIVLIGDVGVGKTAFLKRLMYISAYEEFQKALYIYVDLGSKGALSNQLNDFVLDEIEKQLYSLYGVDVLEAKFVRAVYHGEISRFQKGIYGELRDKNPESYNSKLLEFLGEKTKHRDIHLKQSILHIARGRKKQVIFVLDNADQRDYTIQQDAFIVAQNLSKDWEAAVFIAVRPQTFYKSKHSGSLNAYPHRVFTIAPPRVDQVIEKRLKFALNMAEGRIQIERLQDIQIRLVNISIYLRALLWTLSKNNETVEFLSNITAGNVRAIIEFVTKFIGSANVDAEKIINIMERTGSYVIPVHEFWKEALLGEYSYYDPHSSLALNLFDINNANEVEHFLLPMVLAFFQFDGAHKSSDGFVFSSDVITEMQEWGFSPGSTETALRRANNNKLIETPQRVTFEEDEDGLSGDIPMCFRISTIGAYHLLRWISDFSYLDAMSYDTPILDKSVQEKLSPRISSFSIIDRLERALTFRSYLTTVWHSSNLAPQYFDWTSSIEAGKESFNRVQSIVARNKTKELLDSSP